MRYKHIVRGEFINRPNRFIAHVNIDGVTETVHVKNTGRCRELLIPGCEVYLEQSDNPNRKTKYDLIATRKDTGVLFNIDSQAPNVVVKEWLLKQDLDYVHPEYIYGKSRIDFYIEQGERTVLDESGKSKVIPAWKMLLEVKGCTLERDGIGYFPDAPTERGVKHLEELAVAVKKGYRAGIAFAMQADGLREVRANAERDPKFAEALENAKRAGVEVLFLPCHVEPDSLEIIGDFAI